MEALYSKLYDKYTKLKTKKFTEFDESNKAQELKFLNYVSAAEELIQHLKTENERLTAQVNDLRSEVISVRETKDEQCEKYQKLLMEEYQKNRALSKEVERLQELHQELSCSTNVSGKVSNDSSRRKTRKRSRQSGTEVEEAVVMPDCSVQDDAIARESAKDLSKGTVSSGALVYGQLPECCKSTVDKSGGCANDMGSPKCPFQALIEYLVGMKLSSVNQTEGFGISALHQSSGYSFSLTWVNKAAGAESELLYNVSSLGMLERVATKWMREEIMFSTSMCPIFFEKISGVIKGHH